MAKLALSWVFPEVVNKIKPGRIDDMLKNRQRDCFESDLGHSDIQLSSIAFVQILSFKVHACRGLNRALYESNRIELYISSIGFANLDHLIKHVYG